MKTVQISGKRDPMNGMIAIAIIPFNLSAKENQVRHSVSKKDI